MTEFTTIQKSRELFLKEGKSNTSFVCTVIKEGELTSGTKNNKDWSKKVFTVKDATGSIEIITWNAETNLLRVGYKYEINNPWWNDYAGKINLRIGQYAKIKCVGPNNSQSIIEEPSGDVPPEPKCSSSADVLNLPEPSADFDKLVTKETILLLNIEKTVIAAVMKFVDKSFSPNPNKIGMFVKEIYKQIKSKDGNN